MNQTQFQAGYILDGINDSLKRLDKSKEVKGLLKHLSCFDIETNCNISSNSADSFTSVIHNLIVRGIPTRPSIFIENEFLEIFQKFKKDDSDFTKQLGNIKYESKLTEEEQNSIFSALHIIDPRIKLNKVNYNGKLGSDFEKDFITKYLPENDIEFLAQVLEPQRKLSTIVKPEVAPSVNSQQVDFSIEFPYQQYEDATVFGEKKRRYYNRGFVLEIDGERWHSSEAQNLLDKWRDNCVNGNKWEVKRIKKVEDVKNFVTTINTSASLSILKQNYKKNLSDNWLDILQLTLSPFAIARVQNNYRTNPFKQP